MILSYFLAINTPRSNTSLGFTPSAKETVSYSEADSREQPQREKQQICSVQDRGGISVVFGFSHVAARVLSGKAKARHTLLCPCRLGLGKQGWKNHSQFESHLNQDWLRRGPLMANHWPSWENPPPASSYGDSRPHPGEALSPKYHCLPLYSLSG